MDIFPDFIRNTLVSVSSMLKEYQVIQSANNTLLIRLSPMDEILRVKVTTAMDQLFSRLNVVIPHYHFEDFGEHDYCQKRRRVMRRIDG